jgi:hypothetical protein
MCLLVRLEGPAGNAGTAGSRRRATLGADLETLGGAHRK